MKTNFILPYYQKIEVTAFSEKGSQTAYLSFFTAERCQSLFFRFRQESTVQTFSVKDRTYGFPIDCVLLFQGEG